MLKMGIYDKPCLRKTVEGIFYRLRVGCPWRDLPTAFGNWNAVYKRFNDWSRKEKLMGIFNALVVDPDLEWEFIDGSIVKAHQHSSGAACEQETAIGKSVAGNTSKIHMAVDACGLPIHFSVTGGEVHDCKEAPKLVAELPKGDYIVADRGYDSEALRLQIKDKGAVPVIPRKKIQLGEMMKWIGVSTNIAISLKMCLQDLSISERSPRDMTNSNEILKALSLWLAPFYGYLCEMATAPNAFSVLTIAFTASARIFLRSSDAWAATFLSTLDCTDCAAGDCFCAFIGSAANAGPIFMMPNIKKEA